jgi:CubicO group peptidase (beta-lactamase class C family)
MTQLDRRSFLTVAALGAVGGCGSVYTPDYILRTVTRQDANSDDFRWKRRVVIPASAAPMPIPANTSAGPSTANAFVQALGEETVDQFMARTNAHSLMALRGGEIALERYAAGVRPDTPQAVFSVSKSVLSLLVGQALAAGYFHGLDDPITRYLPELRERDARFDQITLGNLLDMRSGIAFSDGLSFPYITNDAPLVYYASDLRSVVLTRTRIEAEPGAFNYNDYNPNLVALALERAVGAERLSEMRAQFWSALGAEDDAQWSVDNRGFAYWESGLAATPRDLAKIGLLVLQTREQGSPFLSSEWRARISSAPVPANVTEFNGRQWGYRAGWWLIVRPDGRHDIAAIGRFGQMIYVSPANDVVIVRTGGDENAPEDGDLTALFFTIATRLGASG